MFLVVVRHHSLGTSHIRSAAVSGTRIIRPLFLPPAGIPIVAADRMP